MLVSGELPEIMTQSLQRFNIQCIKTTPMATLPIPLRSHPDMQLLNVSEGILVCSPNIGEPFFRQMKHLGLSVIHGSTIPISPYPCDIAYNAAIMGNLAVLNARHTDPVVMDWLVKTGKRIVDVKQGYCKCSIAVVNQEAVITSDSGIEKALRQCGVDVLKLEETREIQLPGYNHGFIGGATGLISENEMVFSGDVTLLREFNGVVEFLYKHGVKPVSLDSGLVVDGGSLIPLMSV